MHVGAPADALFVKSRATFTAAETEKRTERILATCCYATGAEQELAKTCRGLGGPLSSVWDGVQASPPNGFLLLPSVQRSVAIGCSIRKMSKRRANSEGGNSLPLAFDIAYLQQAHFRAVERAS